MYGTNTPFEIDRSGARIWLEGWEPVDKDDMENMSKAEQWQKLREEILVHQTETARVNSELIELHAKKDLTPHLLQFLSDQSGRSLSETEEKAISNFHAQVIIHSLGDRHSRADHALELLRLYFANDIVGMHLMIDQVSHGQPSIRIALLKSIKAIFDQEVVSESTQKLLASTELLTKSKNVAISELPATSASVIKLGEDLYARSEKNVAAHIDVTELNEGLPAYQVIMSGNFIKSIADIVASLIEVNLNTLEKLTQELDQESKWLLQLALHYIRMLGYNYAHHDYTSLDTEALGAVHPDEQEMLYLSEGVILSRDIRDGDFISLTTNQAPTFAKVSNITQVYKPGRDDASDELAVAGGARFTPDGYVGAPILKNNPKPTYAEKCVPLSKYTELMAAVNDWILGDDSRADELPDVGALIEYATSDNPDVDSADLAEYWGIDASKVKSASRLQSAAKNALACEKASFSGTTIISPFLKIDSAPTESKVDPRFVLFLNIMYLMGRMESEVGRYVKAEPVSWLQKNFPGESMALPAATTTMFHHIQKDSRATAARAFVQGSKFTFALFARDLLSVVRGSDKKTIGFLTPVPLKNGKRGDAQPGMQKYFEKFVIDVVVIDLDDIVTKTYNLLFATPELILPAHLIPIKRLFEKLIGVDLDMTQEEIAKGIEDIWLTSREGMLLEDTEPVRAVVEA